METWYKTCPGNYVIEKVEATRSTKKFLYFPSEWLRGEERKESKSGWNRDYYPTLEEAKASIRDRCEDDIARARSTIDRAESALKHLDNLTL